MTDPNFDRALRAAARRGRPVGDHPDAALLASYVDRSLSGDERAQVEAHVADCAECMEHLALLGNVNVADDLPGPLEGFSIRRLFSGWGWLVPVATAILVIAIWERQPERPEGARPSATAAAPATAPAATASAPAASASEPPATAARKEAPRTANGPAPQITNAARAATRSVEAKNKPAGVILQDAQNEAAQKQREEGTPSAAAVDSLHERDKKALDAKDEAKPAPMSEAVRQAGAPATTPPGARGDAAKAEKRAEPLNMARPNEQVAGAFLKSAMAVPVMVATGPGVAIRRVGTRLERSTDGGATWAVDLAPAPESLRVGVCPTSLVCWVGGTAGTVLVRNDAGVWLRRDLGDAAAVVGGIDATDATSARVTLTDGRQFRTSDAGATWSLTSGTAPR